jgi:IS5 family transposase
VEVCLSLRALLKLPLRQTEGFVRSVLALAGLSLPVPDYTTLCRRQRNLKIVLPVHPREQARHIVLDSTGLKVMGEGEWKVKKHGKDRRRVWKELHLSVDETTGEVLAVRITDGDAADGPLLAPLVRESQQTGGRVVQTSADGAYDSWDNDRFLTEQKIVSTIPPRKGSRIRQHGNSGQPPLQRDQNLRAIRRLGRKRWAQESGYARRALAETQMMRQKTVLGGALVSRCQQNQAAECRLRCAILNRLTHLGMPDSYRVCA